MCGGFWFYVALIKNAFVCCVHKNKEKQIKCRGQRGVSACLIVYVWAKWNRLGEDRVSVLCEDVKHSAQWWKSTVKVPVKGWRDFFCWQVRQSQRINRVLTLHAQPIGAVLRLEHHALTVLSPVFGCWVAAFSPPPVGALCPTGGPLTPLCPQAIHYHITDRTDEGRANEMTNEKMKMNLAWSGCGGRTNWAEFVQTYRVASNWMHFVYVHLNSTRPRTHGRVIILIPGQRGLHGSFWMPCPSQMAPPLSGAGLVQLRVRFW